MKFSFAIGILFFVLVANNEAKKDPDFSIEDIKDLMEMTPKVTEDGKCMKYVITREDCELVMKVEKLESLPMNTLIPLYAHQNWKKFVDVVISHNLEGDCFCPSIKTSGCKPVMTAVIDTLKESFCKV